MKSKAYGANSTNMEVQFKSHKGGKAMKTEMQDALKTLEKGIQQCKAEGPRHIVVLDRGWIFVGDLAKQEDGTFLLSNAHNIRKWKEGGFGALTMGAKKSGAVTDECAPIRFAPSVMILSVPIGRSWDE
jgi:hypothetical protein